VAGEPVTTKHRDSSEPKDKLDTPRNSCSLCREPGRGQHRNPGSVRDIDALTDSSRPRVVLRAVTIAV
jgi:hypothetical protein